MATPIAPAATPTTDDRVAPTPVPPASDPWAVPTPQRGAPGWHRTADLVAVAALGTFGAVARTISDNDATRRGSVALALAGLLVACALGARWARPARVAAAVGSTGIVVLLVVPTVGRAPVLVGLAGVVVAHAALVSWRPWPGHPGRADHRVGLAVPLIAAAGLHWYRSGALALTVALLVSALGVVELAGRAPGPVGRADRAIARGVRRVATALATAIVALAVGVLVYLPGAPFGLAERRRRRRLQATSSWVPVVTGVEHARRDAGAPFAGGTPSEARRRLVGGLAVALVLSGATFLVLRDRPPEQDPVGSSQTAAAPAAGARPAPRQPDDPPVIFGREFAVAYSALPAYEDVAWADELQEQEASVPSAETFESRDINLREGRRVTSVPPSCSCPTARVWITGGSAVWGIGQRDDHTIASELVAAAGADGVRLEVDNMGARGSTFTSQVDDIEARLDAGDEPPDVIVVHNGFNEVGAALGAAMAASDDPRDRELVSGGQQDLDVGATMDLEAVNERVEEYLASDLGPEVAATAVAAYRVEHTRLVDLADAHGIEVASFFQPDAFASRRQLDPYEAISGLPTEVLAVSPMGVALERAAAALGDVTTDLRPLFSGEDAPLVFLGLVHHNEAGAALVAAAMAPEVLAAAGIDAG